MNSRSELSTRYSGFTGQYIAGQWRSGNVAHPIVDKNPYDGTTLTEIAAASIDDLDSAYRAAETAQHEWAKTLPAERAAIFHRAAQIMDVRHTEIVDWLVSESGSTRTKAEIEWGSVRAGTLAAALLPTRASGKIIPVDIPNKESRVYKKPLGVIGVISPWNWPMILSNRSIAPALALGNAVVVKPSDETPVTGGLLLAKIYEEAGLPPGLLNVVIGHVADIGDAFTLHSVPKLISFTGSTKVGRRIGELAMIGPSMKRVALELGGNAPCVVLDDADIEKAAHGAVVGRFFHQGQICMSSNRVIVDASIYDRFLEAFIEKTKSLKVGDPNEYATNIGPLINARQVQQAAARIEEARALGIKEVLKGTIDGQLVSPHVFANVKNDSPLAQSELFSPIAPIIKAKDEEDALRMANATEYGLSSSVYTEDEARGVRFAQRLDVGMCHVNDISVNEDSNVMFGGEKNSGIGRFNSDWGLAEFTVDQWISIQKGPRPYPF